MNSVFSVDDIADTFWPSSGGETASLGMGRSESEWAFERLLEEVGGSSSTAPASSTTASNSDQINGDHQLKQRIHPQLSDHSSTAPVTDDVYRAFLKSKLDLACAAVAISRASTIKPGEPGSARECQSQPLKNSPGGSVPNGSAQGTAVARAPLGAPIGIPALPTVKRSPDLQVKQTTSDSSREDSDDDELEGDTGTTESMDPAEAKRFRRMQSNRESARRSRRRKQEHMNELEGQVDQLKIEHTTLLNRLTDMNQKYDKASVDNRILKADIETLRAKVKMAEETVKRVTGISPLLLAMSNIHGTGTNMAGAGIPFVSSPMDTFATGAPMQPNANQFFHHGGPNVSNAKQQQQRLDGFHSNNPLPLVGGLPNVAGPINVGHISPMPNIHGPNSVEQVHERIQPGATPFVPAPGWCPELPHSTNPNPKHE